MDARGVGGIILGSLLLVLFTIGLKAVVALVGMTTPHALLCAVLLVVANAIWALKGVSIHRIVIGNMALVIFSLWIAGLMR